MIIIYVYNLLTTQLSQYSFQIWIHLAIIVEGDMKAPFLDSFYTTIPWIATINP